MKLLLELSADRSAWPPTADGSDAQAGGIVVGSHGLLGIVEVALGMGAPVMPQAVRLARWRAKLAAADTPKRFWHASFGVDPFATAKTVLAWRDSLVDAEWNLDTASDVPSRLADLAAAEHADPQLPPGEPDRLRDVIAALTSAPPLQPVIETLTLLDNRFLLPPGVGRLVKALEACGTNVVELPTMLACPQGDLANIQQRLSGSPNKQLAGDGSFMLLRTEAEGLAADLLTDWLAALPDRKSVVIIAQRPTGVLDAALKKRHLPQLGVRSASAARGLIQLLPLALATRWQPFDAARMLEFLQMPRSPIPDEVRTRLVQLLPQCPGRGGQKWRDAIAEGLTEFASQLRKDDPDNASARIEAGENAVRLWLDAPLAFPEAGLPINDLFAICSTLSAWATRMAAVGIPLASSLAANTSALLAAAQESGMVTLPRLGLERLLDAVLSDGEMDPTVPNEASEWAVVENPGAAWGKNRTVVWWGFDPPPIPSRLPWDWTERTALGAAGCNPWQPTQALAIASAGWRRPILGATGRVLLISIPPPDGGLHPLAHEMAPMLEACPACRPTAEAFLGMADPKLAGVTLARVPAPSRPLPLATFDWTIPDQLPLTRSSHSATAIEELLGCPFRWVLRSDARIRTGRRAEIADGEQLIGQLAHRLAAHLFAAGGPSDPDEIRNAAIAVLPRLVEEAAAPLLQAGAAAERARMAERLPGAMSDIATLLKDKALAVVGTEVEREADDMPEAKEQFRGSIDLLLQDSEGRPALLDLKWTRKADRYSGLLKTGSALQLAAYAKLVGAAERAAYFLLRDGQVFSTSSWALGTSAADDAPSLADTWSRTIDSRRLRLATIRAGTLRALGVGYDDKKPPPDPDEVSLRPTPPCNLCSFGRLCGKEPIT
jgi:ATP-dependent helicase/nuclease subunit B